MTWNIWDIALINNLVDMSAIIHYYIGALSLLSNVSQMTMASILQRGH